MFRIYGGQPVTPARLRRVGRNGHSLNAFIVGSELPDYVRYYIYKEMAQYILEHPEHENYDRMLMNNQEYIKSFSQWMEVAESLYKKNNKGMQPNKEGHEEFAENVRKPTNKMNSNQNDESAARIEQIINSDEVSNAFPKGRYSFFPGGVMPDMDNLYSLANAIRASIKRVFPNAIDIISLDEENQPFSKKYIFPDLGSKIYVFDEDAEEKELTRVYQSSEKELSSEYCGDKVRESCLSDSDILSRELKVKKNSTIILQIDGQRKGFRYCGKTLYGLKEEYLSPYVQLIDNYEAARKKREQRGTSEELELMRNEKNSDRDEDIDFE